MSSAHLDSAWRVRRSGLAFDLEVESFFQLSLVRFVDKQVDIRFIFLAVGLLEHSVLCV